MKTGFDFKLIAFYPAAAQQGQPAAKMEYYEYSILIDTRLMDQDDIAFKANIYGAHPELVKAVEAYRSVAEEEVI